MLATVVMAICSAIGCRQGERHETNSDYDNATSYIKAHTDSIYSNPNWISQRLDSLQQNSTDSNTIMLAAVYNAFCHYLTDNNLPRTMRTMDSIESYCRRHDEPARLTATYWNMRSILSASTDSTAYCLNQALRLIEKSGDATGLIPINANLADCYRIAGKLPEAARHWRRALAICDSTGETEHKTDILTGLAQTYSDMGRYDMADRFFGMADMAQANIKSRYLWAMGRGNSYYARQDYKKALENFRLALGNLGQQRSAYRLLPLYVDLAEVFTLTEEYDSAVHYLNMARQMTEGSVVTDAMYYIYSISADLAFRQGDNAAAQLYIDSLNRCKGVSLTYQYLHKRRMMRHYAQMGNYALAYAYRDEMDRYDDSIRNMQQQANLAEIDYRYDRDTTLLRQQVQLGKSREDVLHSHMALAITLAIMAILWSVAVIYTVRRRRKTEALRRNAMKRITQLRMQGIRNRVTPHLMLNALHSARLTAASPVYEQLVNVLRDNLIHSDSISICLDDELRIVEHYTELYRMTHADCPTITISRSQSAKGQVLLPAMSIQIPVENALKHAFGDNGGDHRIDISIDADSETLHVRISDNGHGYNTQPQATHHNGSGNGIHILCQTFDLLNQLNSRHIRFEIVSPTSPDGGTRVELDVPQDYCYTLNTNKPNEQTEHHNRR